MILELNKISKKYKGVIALDSVDLNVAPGEVLGLFGHNGAGKTTLMKLILGIIQASSGTIEVFGDTPTSKVAWRNRFYIGYLPENVTFYEQLTAKQIIHYFARLKSVKLPNAVAILEQVGLSHAMDRQVKTYSKGMRQRLGLAQAFLGSPKLLLLDEPTVGLDPSATHDFYTSVESLRSSGASILLSSHVLPGAERYIDRALILSKGHSLALGSVATLRQQADLPILIQAIGADNFIQSHPDLAALRIDKDTIQANQNDKIKLLQQLCSCRDVVDIDIKSADLARLYQHYLQQNTGSNDFLDTPPSPLTLIHKAQLMTSQGEP